MLLQPHDVRGRNKKFYPWSEVCGNAIPMLPSWRRACLENDKGKARVREPEGLSGAARQRPTPSCVWRLSGNKLFVSWDDKLIPNKIASPCAYPLNSTPGGLKAAVFLPCCVLFKTKLSPDWRAREGRQEIREYFASFKDDLTVKIDTTYMKYAAAFGPSSKECRELSKMFYQATDLTQDRVALVKKWLKLEKAEPCAKGEVLSRDTSTLSETSRLINDTGNENTDDQTPLIRQRRFFWRRDRPQCCHGYKVQEIIDKEAAKFVKTFAGEKKKIV